MFLPGLIIFFRIFSIKVSKIRFYLLHSGVLRIKDFPFDSVFILFFKKKASLIWRYFSLSLLNFASLATLYQQAKAESSQDLFCEPWRYR